MDKELNISAEDARAAYNNTDANGRELLEHLFGKEMFHPKDIKERIKTFDDACEELGEYHQYVKTYTEWMTIYHTDCKDVTAYLKLRIICAALNDGWKPAFNEDEYRYYPWFNIYTKAEYEGLDEYKMKDCRVVGRSFGGLGFAGSHSTTSYSSSYGGSLLAFKTRELAEYCGKQFIDIWADFLFA